MANAMYPGAIDAFLKKQVDWLADTIKVNLVRGYTYNAAHNWLSDVTGAGGTLLGSDTIGSRTATGGVMDGNDCNLGAIASGAAAGALVIYADTGTPGSSRVIFYIDTGTGLPLTPNGATVTVVWDNGSNKICRIG